MALKQMFDESLTKAALHMLMENFPEDYKRAVDEGRLGELRKKAEATIKETNQIFHDIREKGLKPRDVFAQLPGNRVNGMTKALGKKTFEMAITGQVAKVTRGGAMFRPDINLSTNVQDASVLQVASIVVECVILVLELIGVSIPDDQAEINKAIQIVLDALQKSSKLITDVNNINKDYDSGDHAAMAKDIFVLVVDTFNEGIFWGITKALLSDMPWYDWILTFIQIAASIIMLVATGGLAEIAELVVELIKAAFFLEKLANLANLKKIEMKVSK